MMTLLFNFLRTNWLGVLVCALGGGLLLKLSLQQIELIHVHEQLAQCEARSAVLEVSNHALAGSIKIQNAAVNALRAETDSKVKSAIKALAKARSDAKQYALTAAQLKSQPTTHSECADMKDLIDSYAKNAP